MTGCDGCERLSMNRTARTKTTISTKSSGFFRLFRGCTSSSMIVVILRLTISKKPRAHSDVIRVRPNQKRGASVSDEQVRSAANISLDGAGDEAFSLTNRDRVICVNLYRSVRVRNLHGLTWHQGEGIRLASSAKRSWRGQCERYSGISEHGGDFSRRVHG
jgi:hypothetical protein